MTPTLTRVEYLEPLTLDLSAERDEVGERWVVHCHKVSCATTFVYPDDAMEDEPQEVGEVDWQDVAEAIGETAAFDTDWDDLIPIHREAIIRLWQNEE